MAMPVNDKKGNRGGAGISATIHVTRANGTSSPDHFDLEEGMDEIDYLLSLNDEITAFENSQIIY